MNNSEPLTTSEMVTLGALFGSSALMFYVTYKATYAMYEKKTSQNNINSSSVCLLEYKQWTPQKKADFVSRITSQVHAALAISFAIKALFFTCVDDSKDSTKYSNFFVSDYCLMQHVDMWQMISLAVTGGYLTFDIYICYAHIKEKSSIQTQTYIHHIIALTGFICAVIYGRGGALIIANVLLINEFSTFFLNYRQFLLIFKKSHSCYYKWNAIVFFLAFLFSRIIFNMAVAYWVGRAFYLTTKDTPIFSLPLWQIIIGFYLIGLFVAINVLNFIWFGSILQHARRNLSRNPDDFVKQSNSDEEPINNGPNYEATDDKEEKQPLIV